MMEWIKNTLVRFSEWCKSTIRSDHSWRGTVLWFGMMSIPAMSFGFGFYNLANSSKDWAIPGASAYAFFLSWAGKLLMAFGTFLLIASVLGITFTQVDKQRVNVVAWRSYAESAVLEHFPAVVDPWIIEYVRGIHRIETLRVNNEPIGLLISDAEYLREHHQGEYLMPIKTQTRWENLLEKPFRNIDQWKEHVGDRNGGKVLGIPLRWALNDIIFNKRKAIDAGYEVGKLENYINFNLSSLLNIQDNKYKIGLWNWFLPTLQHLLLCESEDVNIQNVHEVQVRQNLVSITIESVAKVIKNNAERFLVLDSPSEVRERLVEDDRGCWFVYGAGSWALSLRHFEHPEIVKVVPSKGVTCWVECLSFPTPGLNERNLQEQFIDAFLSPKMQVALCSGSEYLGAPVTEAAIAEIAGRIKQSGQSRTVDPLTPYVSYLMKHGFIDHQQNILPSMLVPRRLPKEWAVWDSIWKDVIAEVRSKGASSP